VLIRAIRQGGAMIIGKWNKDLGTALLHASKSENSTTTAVLKMQKLPMVTTLPQRPIVPWFHGSTADIMAEGVPG